MRKFFLINWKRLYFFEEVLCMEKGLGGRFHPSLSGCVAKDGRMAHALEGCYLDALYETAAQSYRAVLCEESDGELSALFAGLGEDALWRFRLIGSLIREMGANPTVRAQLRVDAYEPNGICHEIELRERERMIRDAIREKKREVDRMESLMGKTQDGVVRSLLATLVGEARRNAERLEAVLK